MGKKLALLFVLVLLSGCGQRQSAKTNNLSDRQKAGLKGNVKKVLTYLGNMRQTAVFYDRQGAKTEFIEYDENGYIAKRIVYEYNPKIGLEKRRVFDANGDERWVDLVRNYRDSEGRLITRIKTDPSANVMEKIEYAYQTNSAGEAVTETHWDSSNRLVVRYLFQYNKDGQQISSAQYDENSFMIGEFRSEFQAGKEITARRYDAKNKLLWKETYTYDTNGFRVEAVRYDSKDKIMERNVYENDSKGNRVLWKYFNSEGKIEAVYRYEYQYWE